jgi:hypothetical protein
MTNLAMHLRTGIYSSKKDATAMVTHFWSEMKRIELQIGDKLSPPLRDYEHPRSCDAIWTKYETMLYEQR